MATGSRVARSSFQRLAISVGIALSIGCGFGLNARSADKAPATRAEIERVMIERFVGLHQAYASRLGAEYTRKLRATIRYVRRLLPDQCVMLQRQLVELGGKVGYDGLESTWLVLQDCAAQGTDKSTVATRSQNAALIAKNLRFAIADPMPHLPLRLTYWNSLLERGVRGDALRVLMRRFAGADPEIAQGWTLAGIVSAPSTRQDLCGLPVRPNQFGKPALSELLRQARCIAGGGLNTKDLCDKLFPPDQSSNREIAGAASLGPDGAQRLGELCKGLAGGGSMTDTGIDDLDAYSEDVCNSEDTTHLYETQKILGLVQDCYFGGDSSPFAQGGVTSANYDRILNRIVVWERDGRNYAASLFQGSSKHEAKIYMAEGSTPQEARENLLDQLVL